MSTGLPILATWHGGIPEVVTDGKSGFLVAERDAPALSSAMKKLASNASIYAAMSAEAARAVAEGFEQKTR